jgi:U3 small nucleolar RNA-associated protein MPP10
MCDAVEFVHEHQHEFLDARQPTPSSAAAVRELRARVVDALQALFAATKELEPRPLGALRTLTVHDALTCEQVWAQLAQQNRVAFAFWKPLVKQLLAQGDAEPDGGVPLIPAVVHEFAHDFADDFADGDDDGDDGDDDDGGDGDDGDDDDDDDDDEAQARFDDDDDDDEQHDDDDANDDDDDDDEQNDDGEPLSDDAFFDFDDMEAFADEAEAEAEADDEDADSNELEQHLSKQPAKKRAKRGGGGDDDVDDLDDDGGDDDDDGDEEEEDDDEDDVDLMANAEETEREIKEAGKLKFSDFFGDEQPRKTKKRSAAATAAADDDNNNNDDDDKQGDGEDDEFFELHEYQRIDKANRQISRADGAADDVLPNDAASPFEKAQRAVQAKIAKMEAALVAERPWALKGEVGAQTRPVNSLIETEVEYDHATRPAPVITDEHTQTLEDLIRVRVRDAAYDDVVRRTEADVEADKRKKKELPELNHEKSKLSLAELYAADYVAEREQAAQARLGDDGIDPEALEKVGDELDDQRKEIRQLFEQLCARLDALSHYRARPRLYTDDEAVAGSKTASNVAAARLEHALPVALSQGDTLAPEERYAVKRRVASDVVDRAPGAERRARKNAHSVESKRNPTPAKTLSERDARAAALKQVSQHSNVTVAGKKGKKGDVGVDSERGSTALFKQLQREVSGEVKSKTSKAAQAAAAAALSTKRSGKAAQFKL